MHRVLSLDGGGIRGILTARILNRIEDARPGLLANCDCFAGTSTGSVLALALAKGLKPEVIVTLYQTRGPAIFAPRDFLDRITSLDEIRRADFDPGPLKAALQRSFGNAVIGDLEKDILVPAMNLSKWRPKFFNRDDADWALWEVALASGAAPTYFPAFCGPDGCFYADGGLFANNPADRAITEAQMSGVPLGEVVMLSLGTGAYPRPLPRDAGDMDWGYWQWGIDPGTLLPAIFDTPVMASTTTAARLLGGRFRRIQPQLPEPIDLADVSKIPALLRTADEMDLTPVLGWLDEHWM